MDGFQLDEALRNTPEYRDAYAQLATAGEQEPPPPADWGDLDDSEEATSSKNFSSPWARAKDASTFLGIDP